MRPTNSSALASVQALSRNASDVSALVSGSDPLCGFVANLAVLKPSRDEKRAGDQ
jgi:hypothetical protein